MSTTRSSNAADRASWAGSPLVQCRPDVAVGLLQRVVDAVRRQRPWRCRRLACGRAAQAASPINATRPSAIFEQPDVLHHLHVRGDGAGDHLGDRQAEQFSGSGSHLGRVAVLHLARIERTPGR